MKNHKLFLSVFLFILFCSCQKDNLATSTKKVAKLMQGQWEIKEYSMLDRDDFSVLSTTTLPSAFNFHINEYFSYFPNTPTHEVWGFMDENDSCSADNDLSFAIEGSRNSLLNIYDNSNSNCSYFEKHFALRHLSVLYIPHEDSIWVCHAIDSLPDTYKAYLWLRQPD